MQQSLAVYNAWRARHRKHRRSGASPPSDRYQTSDGVPLQEDANVIGPLPPGLYKVAAEAQEAGCSILTEPIPLDGATQRHHTAWRLIMVVAAQGSAVADGPAAATSERAEDRVAPWRILTYHRSLFA